MGRRPEVWALCLCGLCLLNAAFAEPWARNLKDGLEVKVDNQTYVVQGEWTVLITIDEPRPAAELANFIQQLRVEISRQTMMARWMPHWQSRLDAVEDQCQNPRRWWLRGRTRQRRGVIDGVGDALHYLFGTATDDEVADIHQAVEKLAQNQGRLIHQFSDFTTIVNHTYDEIQASRDQLDLLSIALYNLSAVVDDRVRSLMECVYQQEARANIEEVLYQLERLGDRYVQAHEAWLHRKENLEAGRLTENILPPLVLQDILDSAAGHASQPVTPLQWYYEHLTVVPIWTESYLVYRTQLPVVMPQAWHHVELHAWPVPVDEWQATLILPESVLRNTETGDLDTSPDCFGARPRVCRRGLITHAASYPCLTRLLASSPSYDPACAIELARRMPLDVVHPRGQNRYTLITNGTELALRCTGRIERTTRLPAGVYQLTLESPCTLHGTNWTLPSTFRRSLHLPLTNRKPGLSLNFSFVDIFQDQLRYDSFRANISALGAVDRPQIPLGQFLSDSSLLPQNSASFVRLSHLSWLLVLVVAVVGIVFWRRRQRQQRTLPPWAPVPLEDLKSVDTAASLKPASTLFRFAAPGPSTVPAQAAEPLMPVEAQ